jgi:hypothetical protein
MKIKFTKLILIALASLVLVSAYSCKRSKAKKIAVDTQFAVALFNDTVSIKDVIGKMDSTTNNWLRVRNDSIFAYYADSIKNVLNAGDLIGNIKDVNFHTNTGFTMPVCDPTHNHDTVVDVDKFMTIPFHYDGFVIDEVVMRKGLMNFEFDVQPALEHLKKIEVYSNQIVSEDGEPIVIGIDSKGRKSVNLADYRIVPEDDTVAFGARVTLHIENGVYPGGDYVCDLNGGLQNVGFKTIYATVTKALDSIYNDYADIDFGINGLSGSAYLPVPRINLTYRNTFGLSASSDVTTLEFVNSRTGLVTDLLAADHWVETVEPTNGRYVSKRIGNFVDDIDALAGYTQLNFDGRVTMAMPGEKISVSDTSSIDVIADIEMPFSFRISDLRYTDTFDVKFDGNGMNLDLLDEIDFFLDFNNRIPLEVDVQAYFMRNNTVIDSLFDGNHIIPYNNNPSAQGYSTIDCIVTGEKMRNVLRARQMILSLGASTENISPDPVMLRESNSIALRMRMLTKSSEIEIDNVLNY